MKNLPHAEAFQVAVLPALIRLAVEIGEQKATFSEGCPVIELAGKLIGIHPLSSPEVDDPKTQQALHMARLLRHSLAVGDEQMGFDGDAALSFSSGFLSAETCSAPLFFGDDGLFEKLAMEAILKGWPVEVTSAFRRGFEVRREELRAKHGVE